MRRLRLLAVALVMAVPLAAVATDPPHLQTNECNACHMGHNSPGASLTSYQGNFTLCNTCHSLDTNWQATSTPTPGGSYHRWDSLASEKGATPPNPGSADAGEAEMGKRLDNGKLQCSTCHDQHQGDLATVSNAIEGHGTQYVSPVVDNKTGTGSVTRGASDVTTDAAAKSYLIRIYTAGTLANAKFRLSNDNGRSWYGCSAPDTYVAFNTTSPNPCSVAANVYLNDSTKVQVHFATGSYNVDDQWSFYVALPFLRVDITDSKMCITCHKDRNMSAGNVEGIGTHQGTGAAIVPGTTVFSHPVGEVLANAYDRAQILDADGSNQPGDGNTKNDLVRGASGKVTCLTCHRVHKAYSNSLTP